MGKEGVRIVDGVCNIMDLHALYHVYMALTPEVVEKLRRVRDVPRAIREYANFHPCPQASYLHAL